MIEDIRKVTGFFLKELVHVKQWRSGGNNGEVVVKFGR